MTTPLKGELIKVNQYFIAPGRLKLKVGIAEDGGLFFGLPVNRTNEEHLVSLDNKNAVEIEVFAGGVGDTLALAEAGQATT